MPVRVNFAISIPIAISLTAAHADQWPQFPGELSLPAGQVPSAVVIELPPELAGPLTMERHVPSQYESIQAAVDASFNGDHIIVAEGTYSECITIEDKAVSILGDGQVTIQTAAWSPVLEIVSTPDEQTVHISGVRFTTRYEVTWDDGSKHFVSKGRGVIVDKSRARFSNCVFLHCDGREHYGVSTSYGGAIASHWGWVTVEHCMFFGCTADNGAAISSGGYALDIIGSGFYGCVAAGDGGALRMSWGTLSIKQSRFIANEAKGRGGHLFLKEGKVNLWRSLFANGTAHDGGAVYSDNFDSWFDELIVDDCSFSDNTANAGQTDVWKHAAVGGPSLADARFCGTIGTSGCVVPAMELKYQASCEACEGDTNHDQSVDIHDLMDVLMHWASPDPFTDLDWDGVTDAGDLLQVLEGLGGCGSTMSRGGVR